MSSRELRTKRWRNRRSSFASTEGNVWCRRDTGSKCSAVLRVVEGDGKTQQFQQGKCGLKLGGAAEKRQVQRDGAPGLRGGTQNCGRASRDKEPRALCAGMQHHPITRKDSTPPVVSSESLQCQLKCDNQGCAVSSDVAQVVALD